jgi:response regulator of citrate/malate metabolism
MAQLDIYIKDEDKIKLIRKASRMNISVSKLMVGAALKCDKIVLEDVKDDTE